MYVRNLNGDEYPIQVTSTVDKELNGKPALSCKITSNKVNDLFINDLTEMWVIADHDETEYKIIYAKKKGEGDKLTVDVKAIPLFYDDFDSDRIYEEHNEHMTAFEYFSIVFAGTGYLFVLVDSFDAIQWEGVGKGETRLKLFKDGTDRYKAESKLVGNTVYLESQIGRDTNFQYAYKLNASNIALEIDGSAFWTYAKGFGDYADGEEANAQLVREYTSPLAQIPGIGIRHAPPTYDGRVTNPDVMDASLKALVDESLKISVSSDIHSLRKQGYDQAQPELGDRTFLTDGRIGFDAEVRIVALSVTKDWKGNVLDLKLTWGTPSLTKRHQASINTAVNRITELVEGRRKLPFSVLDTAVQIATKALQSAQTELSFTDNGILAVDKNDPNLVTILNSAGLGVSTDGGTTFENAITGNGIVAELIIAGTLRGMIIEGSIINGGQFNTTGDANEKVNILDGQVKSIGTHGTTRMIDGQLHTTNEGSPITSHVYNSQIIIKDNDSGRFIELVVFEDDLPGDKSKLAGADYVETKKVGYGGATLVFGYDTNNFLQSETIYNRTYSGAANMHVTSLGTIGRSTSAKKYKLDIEEIDVAKFENILKLNPKHWFDKTAAEAYAELLTKESFYHPDGTPKEPEEVNWSKHDVPIVEKIPGLIAEDVIAAGLPEYVQYAKNKEGFEEPEGLMYDRLWVNLIPIIREEKKKVSLLQEENTQLKADMASLVKRIEALENAN